MGLQAHRSQKTALYDYAPNRTGLLLVDTYNDLLSEGGKLWPQVRPVAEAINLLLHLRALVEAARRVGPWCFIFPIGGGERVTTMGGAILVPGRP